MNTKPKIISDEINGARISRKLEIELPNKQVIFVDKWTSWDSTMDENDYEFDSENSKKIFDTLDEDTQDEIRDIINEYKLKL